jgi:hypothetical protein
MSKRGRIRAVLPLRCPRGSRQGLEEVVISRGVSWQVTPRVLTAAMAAGGDEAKRAFDAMMKMRKIDVAEIEAAPRLSEIASP